MKNITEKYGQNAGKVWVTLNRYGPLSETTLIKNTRLPEEEFYAAVGWLARENKICKNGSIYELKETNLTNKIGGDAGRVWGVLNTRSEIDVSSIAKVTQIDERDAYSALGWLAREDKIKVTKIGTKNQPTKFGLK